MNGTETQGTKEWIVYVGEFQKRFKPYFPRLENDFGAAEIEMSWLDSSVIGNPLETVRRAEALREVKKFKSLMRQLADMKLPGSFGASFELCVLQNGLAARFAAQSDGYHVEERSALISNAERGIMASINAIKEIDAQEMLMPALDALCSRMERGICNFHESGNINWEAVHAVDRLRVLWKRNTGKDAPARALNSASKFSNFLEDGFAYLEINANVMAAFRRWSATSRVPQTARKKSRPV